MLVKESISFERGREPKKALGLDESSFVRGRNPKDNLGLSIRADIERWLEEFNITDYTINKDLIIDARWVNIAYKHIEELPSYIQFGKVFDFDAGGVGSEGLISLRGCPKYVERDFDVRSNNLKNLVGGPIFVGKNYYAQYNKLTSLKGIAKKIGGVFSCGNNSKSFSEEDVIKLSNVEADIHL